MMLAGDIMLVAPVALVPRCDNVVLTNKLQQTDTERSRCHTSCGRTWTIMAVMLSGQFDRHLSVTEVVLTSLCCSDSVYLPAYLSTCGYPISVTVTQHHTIWSMLGRPPPDRAMRLHCMIGLCVWTPQLSHHSSLHKCAQSDG